MLQQPETSQRVGSTGGCMAHGGKVGGKGQVDVLNSKPSLLESEL